jgi:hypothetical protein
LICQRETGAAAGSDGPGAVVVMASKQAKRLAASLMSRHNSARAFDVSNSSDKASANSENLIGKIPSLKLSGSKPKPKVSIFQLYPDLRSLTAAPPLFSAMNSTPAAKPLEGETMDTLRALFPTGKL